MDVAGRTILAWVGISVVSAASLGGPVRESELRLADSPDGRSFTDRGEVLCAGAAAPSLVRLPDGDWLLIFDHATADNPDALPALAATRSSDEGRSWWPIQPVELRDDDGREVRGWHGDLVRVRHNVYRLYFATPLTRPGVLADRPRSTRSLIRTAVTRDGIHYRVDNRADIGLAGPGDWHPMAARFEKSIHLFAGDAGEFRQSTVIRHRASRDGRRFERVGSPQPVDHAFVGTVLSVEDELLAYVSGPRGISVLRSRDGERWQAEDKPAIAPGWDPAVVRLRDGAYLMVYCRERKGTSATPLVATEDGKKQRSWSAFTDGAESSADDERAAWLPSDDDEVLDFADDEAPAIHAERGGLPPRPDFAATFDYVDWFRRELATPVFDDAGEVYATFLPIGTPASPSVEAWPEFNDMFNGGQHEGPPIPWNPAEHPDWEASREDTVHLLEGFRDASMHADYRTPVMFDDVADTSEEDLPALVGMRLPTLTYHRALTKATLSAAWRTENGVVPPEQMLESFETVLRNADHMHQGVTLIENLVGLSEEHLTRVNARWALEQGVFDAEEDLAQALDLLLEADGPPSDPRRLVRGEHAFALDTLQYMYTPSDESGQPQVNGERIERVAELFSTPEEAPEFIDKLRSAGPDDVAEAVDAIDDYYVQLGELMHVGYPDVRAADINTIAERMIAERPIHQAIVPSLGHVHQLRARAEAERRATQLSFAAKLFEKRHGRWPESLDEIPEAQDGVMRVDPFTGADFAYRLGQEGPTIRSAGENSIDDNGEAESDDYVYWPPQRH